MKQSIIIILRYIHHFGFISGLTAYLKVHILKNVNPKITLPNFLHPIYLRKKTSDIQAFDQVLGGMEYDYKHHITPKFIIDCGANIGLATLFFKSKYPDAQIIAAEPETTNFEMLVKNTKNYANIHCLKYGIWHKNAILKIEDERNFGNWGFVCKEVEKENETSISAISISEIMKKYNQTEIDILKIDIEGGEIELFSSNYEYWLPKTKVIMIELHDAYIKGCSKSFFTALMKYDFSVFQRGENIICIRN